MDAPAVSILQDTLPPDIPETRRSRAVVRRAVAWSLLVVYIEFIAEHTQRAAPHVAVSRCGKSGQHTVGVSRRAPSSPNGRANVAGGEASRLCGEQTTGRVPHSFSFLFVFPPAGRTNRATPARMIGSIIRPPGEKKTTQRKICGSLSGGLLGPKRPRFTNGGRQHSWALRANGEGGTHLAQRLSCGDFADGRTQWLRTEPHSEPSPRKVLALYSVVCCPEKRRVRVEAAWNTQKSAVAVFKGIPAQSAC